MMDIRRLPEAEKPALRVGYLRLTDSAPLIVAAELGLYRRYGLDVTLQQEVSWANVRDKVAVGELDAAQMLAPLPLATSMGLGGLRAEMLTGLALSLNGNAITLGNSLSREITARGGDARESAASTARALGAYLRERDSGEHLTLASVHPFSCHTFQLRNWLQAGGIDPEHDVRIIVLPPQQMVDSLSRGSIDGFCVGEPWNTLAVHHGVGAVQATGYDIWNNVVEKVLGVTEQWHQQHPATHLRLRMALMEACGWLSQEENRKAAVTMLASPDYLDIATEFLLPSLAGQFVFGRGQTPETRPHFHVFGRFQAGFPWRSHGEWLLSQMGDTLGKQYGEEQAKSLVQASWRTDLYREAARNLDMPCPQRDYQPMDSQDELWEIEPGIELGPNRLLCPPVVREHR